MSIVLNGQLQENNQVVLDTGFYYGHGVFETILVRNRQGVFLDRHLSRLNSGLEQLNINQVILNDDCQRSIELLDINDGVIKINVSENNIVYSHRYLKYMQEDYEEGVALTTSKVRANPTDPLVYIKSMNYSSKYSEMKFAKSQGWHDALYLNHLGNVCETSTANIFFITDNHIVTPNLSSGMLPGVTRQWVIETMKVEEREIHHSEIGRFQSAFITNSVFGIMKVSFIDEKVFSHNKLIETICDAFNKLLESY